ncbi:MAG: macro domain-containing protein [Micrococcales bacterium]
MQINVQVGDITKIKTDAIVNAANTALRGGSGVDGAIHKAAGAQLMYELVERYPDGMAVGDAVVTFGYDLPAMYIIHTVGPHYMNVGIDHEALLASCYRRCLEEADRIGLQSIAFPAISTGVYLYPLADATRVALQTIASFEPESLESVSLVFFTEEDAEIARSLVG